MENNKKTKRDFFIELREIAKTEEQISFINHELELLDRKKASGAKGESEENIALMNAVLTYFNENPNAVATCTQLVKALEGKVKTEKPLSTSKISSIMIKICGNTDEPIADSPIKRERDKRTTYFKKA